MNNTMLVYLVLTFIYDLFQVFVNPDEEYNVGVPSFDFLSADTLVASTTDGFIYIVDTRSNKLVIILVFPCLDTF